VCNSAGLRIRGLTGTYRLGCVLELTARLFSWRKKRTSDINPASKPISSARLACDV